MLLGRVPSLLVTAGLRSRRPEQPCEHARVISGFVHPDFGGVTQALRKVAAHKRGGGAAVAVYHRGELVVDAWTGARDAAGHAVAIRHDGDELLDHQGRHRHDRAPARRPRA